MKKLTCCFFIFLFLTNILSPVISKTITKLKVNKSKKVSAKEGIFGSYKSCGSQGSLNLTKYGIPHSVETVYNNIIVPISSALQARPVSCVGDFTGKEIKVNFDLANMQCTKLPLDPDHQYSVVGVALYKVPCPNPEKPGTLSGCMVFDKEGTVGVIINGGILRCGMATTGVGKIFEPFAKFVGAMGFGFSLNKKFMKTFEICYGGQSLDVRCNKVTARGHFTVVLNLAFPEFKIGSLDLTKYFQLNATNTLLIDATQSISAVKSLVSELTNSNSCNKGTNILSKIRDMGSEITFISNGYITLKMNDLTNGFICNLNFELNETAFVFTTGGGSTGLEPGVYFHFNSNVIKSITGIFVKLFNHFTGVLGSVFKIPMPDLSFLDISFGFYINIHGLGFKFDLITFEFECAYRFSDSRFSCKFDTDFFTILKEAVKFVIKKVGQLMSDAGEVVGEFAANTFNDTIDFAEDAGKAVAEFSTKAAEEVADAVSFYFNFFHILCRLISQKKKQLKQLVVQLIK